MLQVSKFFENALEKEKDFDCIFMNIAILMACLKK